jgi:hypothetical protein
MSIIEWRKLLRWLRKNFPTNIPIKVKRAPSKKNHAITRFDGRVIQIRVGSDQDRPMLIDSMLHEYAHALAIDDAYSHKETWGRLYSMIYTAYEKRP